MQESDAVTLLEDALQQAWAGDVTTADLQRNFDAAKAKLRKSRGE
jgi:isocitrate dehydrogenase